MKNLIKIWGTGLIAIMLSLIAPQKSMAQGGYISDQQFYDELQPYGTWVSDPEYGNVWIPDADEGFRPYATRGHWIVTDYGNTWVSDYEWGWAPFHYGRWRYDDYYGWEWIPGHEWAPAWVSWRRGGGYYGWAPLTPGVSISVSIGSGYSVPDNYWVCAPEAYIASPVIYNYYVARPRTVTIIHNTTIINNTYVRNNVTYATGPRVTEVRQVTHNNNIRVYNVNNSARPGVATVSRNTVNIYRPAVHKAPNSRPTRVVDASAYRKQHPDARIANTGAAGYNHQNAARLATVARSKTPDNKVVRVNQPVNRPAPNRPNSNNTAQAQQQKQAQQQRAQQQKQRAQTQQREQHRQQVQVQQKEKAQAQQQRAQTQQREQQRQQVQVQQKEKAQAQQQRAQTQQREQQRQQVQVQQKEKAQAQQQQRAQQQQAQQQRAQQQQAQQQRAQQQQAQQQRAQQQQAQQQRAQQQQAQQQRAQQQQAQQQRAQQQQTQQQRAQQQQQRAQQQRAQQQRPPEKRPNER